MTNPTSYVQVESDMIGVTYMSCGIESVDEAIKTCAENYSKSLRLSGPGTTRASLVLSFYERHKKKVDTQSEYCLYLKLFIVWSITHSITNGQKRKITNTAYVDCVLIEIFRHVSRLREKNLGAMGHIDCSTAEKIKSSNRLRCR